MNQSASKSSIQLISGAVIGRVLAMAALVIVTPILGPHGFGQLLIVGIIQAVFTIFLDIGFENYYIMKVKLTGPNITDQYELVEIENAVYNLRFFTNILFFVLQIAISYVGKGWLFDSPVDVYLRILALNYIANLFGKINEVRLKKRMRFGEITSAKIAGDVIGSIAKVLFVLLGFGITGWAAGYVLGAFVNNIMLWYRSDFKPVMKPIPKFLRKDLKWFTKHSWFSGIGAYFQMQSSNIILKHFFPLAEVGLVQFSSSYTIEIYSSLFASQIQLLVPYFSNNTHDVSRIRAAINQFAELSYLLFSIPLVMGIFFGREIINLAFGKQWLDAFPVFVCYCFYVLARLIYSPAIAIYNSIGKLKVGTYSAYFHLTITIIGLTTVSLLSKSIVHFAIVLVITTLVGEAFKSLMGLHYLSITIFDLLRDARKSIYCTLLLFGITFLLRIAFVKPGIVSLIAIFAIMSVSYLIMQWVFNRRIFSLALEKVKTAYAVAADSTKLFVRAKQKMFKTTSDKQ